MEHTAEIKYQLVAAAGVKAFERSVSREHHHDIGCLESLGGVRQLKARMALDVWLHNQKIGPCGSIGHSLGDMHGRTLAQIVDIGFERETHQRHGRLAAMIKLEAKNRVDDLFGTPFALVIIGLAGLRYDLRLLGISRDDKIRIDRDTVAADARAGTEYVDTRMAVGKPYEFPDVDAGLVTDQRQLVGKRYLNIARRVFRQFAHLGRARVGGEQLALDKASVERLGALGRSLVETADHPVVVHQLVDDVAGQHTLGAIGYMDSALELGALGEDHLGHRLGRADGRRRFDHKKIAGFQHRDHRTGRTLDVRHIRLMITLERSRHYDKKRVGSLGR